MRVALFFDGKNHMKDLRLGAGDRWLDHDKLTRWVVERVGGTRFVGAHYYTGVPSSSDDSGRKALTSLLDELAKIPGFFIHTFPRQDGQSTCEACGHVDVFTREKQVDTSIVADIVRGACEDRFDAAVLFSGDADLAPALRVLSDLGKPGWVASFRRSGTSRTLDRDAWGMIDLLDNLEAFAMPEIGDQVQSPGDPTAVDAEVLRELGRAEEHFGKTGGFVGGHFFLHRWRGHGLPDDPRERQASIERLMQAGLVERYEQNGRTALRSVADRPDPEATPDDAAAPEDASS